jgi:hypothetical protein
VCRAISILKSRINLELIEEYNLHQRVHRRGDTAEEELVFDYADRANEPALPVIHDGRLCIYPWGNRAGKIEKLPQTGWCRKESLEAGKWRWLSPEPVVIPAQFGCEKGVWFSIVEGLRGVAVAAPDGQWHAFLLTQQASVYFQNMTRHDRMPMLLGEQM